MTAQENEAKIEICLLHVIKRFGQACRHAEFLAKPQQTDGDTSKEIETEDVSNHEILFVIRMAQTLNWANALQKEIKQTESQEFLLALKEFRKCCKRSSELRDFHAHENEYCLGEGRFQKQYETREDLLPLMKSNGLSSLRLENVTITQDDLSTPVEALHVIGGDVIPLKEVLSAMSSFQVLMRRWQEKFPKQVD